MQISAKEAELVRKARLLSRVMWFLIWAAVLLFLSLWTLPAPVFKGFSLAVVVGYFISLVGVSLVSFLWLVKFDGIDLADEGFVRAKRSVLISLIISIIAIAGSALFVLFALAVGGLFNMI